MNDEARLMVLIWESISDFVISGEKQDAADALVASFVELGHDVEQLYDAEGECPFLDRALVSAAAANEDDEEPGYNDEEY